MYLIMPAEGRLACRPPLASYGLLSAPSGLLRPPGLSAPSGPPEAIGMQMLVWLASGSDKI